MATVSAPSPWNVSPWKGKTFSVQGQDITEVSVEYESLYGDDKLRMTLIGESARAILSASLGNPVPEDLELTLARQDAARSNERAVAAEAQAASLQDEVQDCLGEIEALKDELKEERETKAKSLLGGSSFFSENWHVTYTPSYADVSQLAHKILEGHYENRIHGGHPR